MEACSSQEAGGLYRIEARTEEFPGMTEVGQLLDGDDALLASQACSSRRPAVFTEAGAGEAEQQVHPIIMQGGRCWGALHLVLHDKTQTNMAEVEKDLREAVKGLTTYISKANEADAKGLDQVKALVMEARRLRLQSREKAASQEVPEDTQKRRRSVFAAPASMQPEAEKRAEEASAGLDPEAGVWFQAKGSVEKMIQGSKMLRSTLNDIAKYNRVGYAQCLVFLCVLMLVGEEDLVPHLVDGVSR
ncbi:hypothetical protein CYMTET_34213, partial [Cymbomonas tetramitiformis]